MITVNVKLFLCIVLSFFNAVYSFLIFLLDHDYLMIKHSAILSFFVFIALVLLKFDNILFLARTLFLGFIGYLPIIVKALHGQNSFFSPYEFSTQGISIVYTMYACTSLALFGNEIGLMLGARKSLQFAMLSNTEKKESSNWKLTFFLSIPFIFIISLLVAHSNGPLVFNAGYHGRVSDLPMGVIPSMGVSFLLLSFVAISKSHIKYGRLLVFGSGLFLLLWAMLLRGDRNDALSALLGVLVIYGVVRGRSFNLKLKSFLLVFFFMAMIDIYGSVRSLDIGSTSLNQIASILVNERFSSDIVKFGTVSAIASTFSNTVWAVDSGVLDYAWGQSYLEFIPRTLPKFLYPDRPKSYALMFESLGLRTGGGFFELAEAYMNFGLVGCFIFPLLISFFISRVFSNALIKQDFFSYAMLIGMLSVFFRATWYQSFGFYRGATISITIYLVCWLIHQVISRSVFDYNMVASKKA